MTTRSEVDLATRREESRLDALLRVTTAVFGVVAAGSLVVLMMATVVDVLVRWVSRASLPGMLEVAETALVVAAFFGVAWTSVQGGHVAVSIVTDRLSPMAGRVVDICVWVFSAGLLGWMTYANLARATLSTSLKETRFGLVQWPVWPMRWVIAIGLALWLIVAIANVARTLRGRLPSGEESPHPADV
jgi:TRAP-type C4-dicarboxylate transport system, small permease component